MKIACFSVALLAIVNEHRVAAAEQDEDDLFAPTWLTQDLYSDSNQWDDLLTEPGHGLAQDDIFADEIGSDKVENAPLGRAVMASQTLAQPQQDASDGHSDLSDGSHALNVSQQIAEPAPAREITANEVIISQNNNGMVVESQEKKENKSNNN